MQNQLISAIVNLKQRLWLVGGTCLATMVLQAAAQQSTCTYDASGNTAAIATTGITSPAIEAQPQTQLFQTNASVSLSVVATGVGLSYQWLSNGVPILGATSDTLFLPNLTGTNGSFSVIISNYSGSATSAPVNLWADSNGNGIPDWWEMQYFGNLNQTAGGDYDGDGVCNLDEYLEGTNPTNALSFDPRLYIQSLHGRVVASPDLPYYRLGQLVTLTAVPDAGQTFLSWGGAITGNKSQITLVMNGHRTITATFGLPLPVALNNTNLIWTTGGNAPWYGQTGVSHDGTGAAQCGTLATGQQSWLQTMTSLSQSNQLSFWWNVSSQPPNGMTFSIDGTVYASISGEAAGWQHLQTYLAAGTHTLLWTYNESTEPGSTGIPFSDSGWVGDVTLTPLVTQANAPVLSIQLATTNTALLFWPASSNTFRLQQNSALGTTNWLNVTNAVGVVGGQNQVPITLSTSNQFYRLAFP